jgi:hypothetical protein
MPPAAHEFRMDDSRILCVMRSTNPGAEHEDEARVLAAEGELVALAQLRWRGVVILGLGTNEVGVHFRAESGAERCYEGG